MRFFSFLFALLYALCIRFFFTSNLWLFAFRFYALVFPASQRHSSSSSAGVGVWAWGRWETISMGRAKGIYMALWPFKGSHRLTFVCCFVSCDLAHALFSLAHCKFACENNEIHWSLAWLGCPGGAASCLIEMSFVLAGLTKYLEHQQQQQQQQKQNLQNVMSLMTLPKEF